MSEERVVQIMLLGEVGISTTDGTSQRVGGPRVRLLLALLALQPSRPVRCATLISAIWDGSPPAEPTNALHTLVKRLRAMLPPSVSVESSAGGYRLRAEIDDIDVHRFAHLVDEGVSQAAAGESGPAARTLDTALGLWRGEAFADLADIPDLCWHADRWNELRLDAVEARADAYLSLGRGCELVASLARELQDRPLRESMAARLIQALAASGQQARALEVFDTTRDLLRTELGVSPSRELAQARARIASGAHVSAPRLPVRITSFIGREPDLERLGPTLGSIRLLTLTGPGGVGKTSLAVEAANRMASQWSGGCRLVDLAAAGHSEVAGEAILAQLGSLKSTRSRLDLPVGTRIGRRELLLILDSCEHVPDLAPLVSELLKRCPNLTILATSREPLGVDGETLFPVQPLALPTRGSTSAAVLESPAVQLFLDRARAARSGFVPTGANCETVGAICRRLDGIPLALELAAARVRSLSPEQILDRLSDRFRLLVGNRAAVERHRSLHAAIMWSWEALNTDECAVAQQLSTMPEGASLEILEEICTGEVIEPLTALVNKSLVEFDGRRYRMFETIRAFASETVAAEHHVA
ncbi:ATP-binding protein [Nocardia sp. GAS34]|uniref:ATP-binding protein n=1 Tax=unclassified Nocardia TaxID=2637762 RepID=UPI003D1A6F5C